MSLAARVRDRKRAALEAAAKAVASRKKASSRRTAKPNPPPTPFDPAAAVEAAAKKAARKAAKSGKPAPSHRPSLAVRRRQKIEAIKAAANDNAPELARDATPYELILQQLGEDHRRLKAHQSLETRTELKRAMLPAYEAWVEGALEAGREGKAVQDEVVVTVMIWRLDVADYDGALDIAEHALTHGLKMPERFNRTLGAFVAEQVAEAALATETAGAAFPHGVLERTSRLTETADMPDPVRAKLFKALGLELFRLADAPPEGQEVAGWRPSHLSEALKCLTRAFELHAGVGVKKTIERATAELKKEVGSA